MKFNLFSILGLTLLSSMFMTSCDPKNGPDEEGNLGDTFKVGELTYYYISKGECGVAPNPDATGNIQIPEKVTYLLKSYEVTEIGKGAFKGSNISSLTLPSTIVAIKQEAFANTKLKNLSFSDCKAIESVGSYAFSNTKLQSLDFSDCSSLSNLADYVFANSTITELNLENCISLTTIPDYAFSQGSYSTIILNNCSSLSAISAAAFQNCKNVGNILMQDCTSLEELYPYTFENSGLQFIDLTNCSSLTKIGEYALAGIGIKINSQTQEYVLSLKNCKSLTIIEKGAFQGCGFTKIDFSGCSSLNSIGDKAFLGCGYTLNFDFSGCDEIQYIGSQAFAACGWLPSFNLMNSKIEVVSNETFLNDRLLRTLTLPSSVKEIKANAFTGCEVLNTINCYAIVPPVCSAEVMEANRIPNVTVAVPASSLPAYQSDPVWSRFKLSGSL